MRRNETRRDLTIIVAVIVVCVAGYAVVSAYRAGGSAGIASAESAPPATENQSLTLDPKLFAGPVRQAYQVAHDHPALLAQMHCYCGCDRTNNHKNLLDCFRDRHGSSCEICVGEAIEASQLAKQGAAVEQIRDALRARFDHKG